MLNYCANGPAGYNLTNSLRFRGSNSAYLNRTPASATNRQIWTWSGWIKRGNLVKTDDFRIFSARNISDYTLLSFRSSSAATPYALYFEDSSTGTNIITSQVFRDPSAWYHIIVAVDTTQATAANRVKIYINGSQVTAFSTATYPTQNGNTWMNNTVPHGIGNDIYENNQFFDGYMTEINFVAGQQLTPSSFGSTNALTSVWQPKQYTGTYGTNGFYLNFSNIALTSGSNTGLGKDYSGNGNYWNTNNISVTSGTTYDAMTDVPTLTSATVANYCTLNPLMTTASNPTYSNGNLQAVTPLSGGGNAYGTIQLPSSGKYYWEAQCTSSPTYFVRFGVSAYSPSETFFYNNATSLSYDSISGNKVLNTVNTAYGSAWNANQIIGIAVDLDSGTVTFYNNGVSQGAITYNAAGLFPAFCDADNVSATYTNVVNFGQRPFTYTPPTGYVALNTYNLPTSTIVQGNKYMDATLYTGNGSTQTITNTAGFQPDLIWDKARSNADTNSNMLVNSNLGRAYSLSSNQTSMEGTSPAGYDLVSFNSNGFTVGPASQADMNTNAWTFVAWQWKANGGTNTTNTSGSITSTVQANTTSGFSIISYAGSGATSATVGHGLGVAPSMFIVRRRNVSTASWLVWHKSFSSSTTNYLLLDGSNSVLSYSTMWGTQTSSTIGLSPSAVIGEQNSSGSNYVIYAWTEIAGYSKIGSYTGNGVNNDGPFVYCGFRPKFVMFKNINTSQNWIIMDTARDPYNKMTQWLFPNTSGAEYTDANIAVDYLSNGFKIRTQIGTELNGNGNTIIYAAFAENPFKNALAR